MTPTSFSQQVAEAFGRRVAGYEPQARLQRGVAWRLAGLAHQHVCSSRQHPESAAPAPRLPAGPCADLGAGTGLLGQALAAWGVSLPGPLLQLDLCEEALARNGTGPTLRWDLNDGLPTRLQGAALLASSFALQWLEAPAAALAQWGGHLAHGGWLLLAVPTAGSFPQWRLAAERAQVPCSALALPSATALEQAVRRAGLEPMRSQLLRFANLRPAAGQAASPIGPAGPLAALRALRAIGADASRLREPLSLGEWRRLLAAWPEGGQLSWEVWVGLARKPHAALPAGGGRCSW